MVAAGSAAKTEAGEGLELTQDTWDGVLGSRRLLWRYCLTALWHKENTEKIGLPSPPRKTGSFWEDRPGWST